MAIDAVIESVRHGEERDRLLLKPRIDKSGRETIPGRRVLYITKNPERAPRVGDEIWGGAHTVRIDGHQFNRIMPLYDGTFEVLE